MAGYIEQERGGEFFCPASQTVQVNPDMSRWKWLIDGWDKMNFKDRMALFTTYVKVVRLFSQKSNEFEDFINNEIVNFQFTSCRKFSHLKYDEDHHGTPCFILVFDPIDLNAIPDAATRSAMKMWDTTYGFYKDTAGSSTITNTCPVCNR